MKSIEESAREAMVRYSLELYEGDELEMVRAAVAEAIRQDRQQILTALDAEKAALDPRDGTEATLYFNAGVYWAQSTIRDNDEQDDGAPLTLGALTSENIEWVARHLASRKIMTPWSFIDEATKAQFRRDAKLKIIDEMLAEES